MTLDRPLFVHQGSFGRLRELKKLLAGERIRAEIVEPPGANANA